MFEKKDNKHHILFVCQANLNRSPTSEDVFKSLLDSKKWEVKSAGCYFGYPHQVNEKILNWADYIFCMDLQQEIFIRRKYEKHYKKVYVIGISDEYDRGDEKLKRVIKYWYYSYFKPKYLD